jgi:hypothetical protein
VRGGAMVQKATGRCTGFAAQVSPYAPAFAEQNLYRVLPESRR